MKVFERRRCSYNLMGQVLLWDQQRGSATEVQKQIKWMARLDVGGNPTVTNLSSKPRKRLRKYGKPRSTQPPNPSRGTVEDLKTKVAGSDISDITPYLRHVDAIVFFYWCKRRQGDVIHFCELRVAGRAVEGFRFAACVVDIVHGRCLRRVRFED